MFRFKPSYADGASGSGKTRHLLSRALLFAAGLVLLWLALHLMPASAPPETASIYSDDAGTVAVNRGTALPQREERSLFSAGTVIAFLLLGGGGVLALYLRRRTARQGMSGPLLQTVGHLSLAPNQQLRLVRCSDEVLLLGVTSGQITLLKSYPAEAFARDEEGMEEGEEAVRMPDGIAPSSFASLLRRHMGPYLNTQSTSAPC